MRLLVYMRDGRTVYKIVGRGFLAKLVRGEPWDEDRKGGVVGRGIWNPATGEYVWMAVRLQWLSKNSISVVEEDTYGGDAPEPGPAA